MVLGRSLPRLRSDGSRLFAVRHNPAGLPPEHSWPVVRGNVLFEAHADLSGGFPGYADRGCALHGVQVRVTENYLLVAEGEPHGFGLPLAAIDGTVLVELPGRDDYALRIFYRLDGQARLCTLTFRSGRVGARGSRRSVRTQEALHRAGLRDRYAESPPLEPDFTLPWDQTREFEHENVIWTGRASAPIRVGAEPAASEVWLTTKSLIWGSGDGDGINRVPLPLLMDMISTRLRDRIGTPAIYLAIGDELTGRYELPFVFSLHTPPDRNFRERGAFLVGLRSRGLEDGAAAAYCQPWRTSLLTMDQPMPLHEEHFDEQESGVDSAGRDSDPLPAGPNDVESPIDGPDNISDFTVLLERRRSAERGNGSFGRRLTSRPSDFEPAESPELAGFELDTAAFTLDSSGLYVDPVLADRGVETEDLPNQMHGETPPELAGDSTPDEAGDHVELIAAERDDSTEPFLTTVIDAPNPGEANADVVLAEWTGIGSEVDDDVAISQSWAIDPVIAGEELAGDATDAETASEDAVFELAQVVQDDESLPFPAVRAYEAAAVGALTEVLRAIDARVAGNETHHFTERSPSSWDQARALTELAQAAERGEMASADAHHRSERLMALGDVCVRLRTLVELHANGILATDQLDAKRIDLMNSLSAALAGRHPASPKSEVV